MSLRSLFRRLAPELIPAFMLSLLVIGLWWWFNARPASPPRLDSACSRPVEIRIQGQGPGSYVACSLEEWIEVGRRLELPSGWPENVS